MNSGLALLVGGSALLIYSMQALANTVQYLAGSKFKVWIDQFTRNSFNAAIMGFVLSVVLSSSSVVTVMLVGLANARLLSLRQVLAVTLGAGVGTTFIVHLIAFNISQYSLWMIAIGVFLSAVVKTTRSTRITESILFLGILFFAMGLLNQAGNILEHDEFFQYTLHYFKHQPLVTLIISALFTAFIHSSAATIALVMSIMASGESNLLEAIPWVIGANIGTTATAYFASFKSGILGKQAALSNLIAKLVGAVIAYFFMSTFAEGVSHISSDVARQIAWSHTLFNVLLLIIFFPFINLGVKLVRFFIPLQEQKSPFSYRYLDERSLNSPELALAQAQREILRLSDTVEKMVTRSLRLFERWDETLVENIHEKDQVVDYLNKGIKMYLTNLSQGEMTREQVQREFMLLLRTNDLENIGDIVDRHILELAKKQHKKGYKFSEEGWKDICSMHAKVIECLQLSTAYFSSSDRKLGSKLMHLDHEIEELLLEFSERHLTRLHRGVKESINTTSVHLDLLGNLQRIGSLAINFATHQTPFRNS